MTREIFDTIIIGGSYSGLSAAMALGRSLRDVLIIDANEPCNAPTPHSHNFLTQDGNTPGEISRSAKEQVLNYSTVTFGSDFAENATRQNDTFVVKTKSGGEFRSLTLLLATGVKDTYPSIPGLKECWGKSVLHCPYCHGYEVRGKRLAVISNGETAVDFAKMVLNLSQDMALITNGPPELTFDERAFLESMQVPVLSSPVAEIAHEAGQLHEVRFENGESRSLDALFIRLPFTHHSDLAKNLGCAFTASHHIEVDNHFAKTSVEGVYAAGDCTTPQRSVSIAVASGTKAGIGINKYLIDRKKFAVIEPTGSRLR